MLLIYRGFCKPGRNRPSAQVRVKVEQDSLFPHSESDMNSTHDSEYVPVGE